MIQHLMLSVYVSLENNNDHCNPSATTTQQNPTREESHDAATECNAPDKAVDGSNALQQHAFGLYSVTLDYLRRKTP